MSGDGVLVVVTVEGGIADVWHEDGDADVRVFDFDVLDSEFVDSDTVAETFELIERMTALLERLEEPSTRTVWAERIAGATTILTHQATSVYGDERGAELVAELEETDGS